MNKRLFKRKSHPLNSAGSRDVRSARARAHAVWAYKPSANSTCSSRSDLPLITFDDSIVSSGDTRICIHIIADSALVASSYEDRPMTADYSSAAWRTIGCDRSIFLRSYDQCRLEESSC